MKWLYTIVTLLVVSLPVVGTAVPVTFDDPNLKAEAEAELGVTDPNTDDMLNLTSLFAPNKGIADLTGLETALNLEVLFLPANDLTSIQTTILAPLTKLKDLILAANQIGGVPAHAFATLTDLEDLVLASKRETNWTPKPITFSCPSDKFAHVTQ